ncbi:hypothetical protein Tco_0662029 [Tanacetum coccineum]
MLPPTAETIGCITNPYYHLWYFLQLFRFSTLTTSYFRLLVRFSFGVSDVKFTLIVIVPDGGACLLSILKTESIMTEHSRILLVVKSKSYVSKGNDLNDDIFLRRRWASLSMIQET